MYQPFSYVTTDRTDLTFQRSQMFERNGSQENRLRTSNEYQNQRQNIKKTWFKFLCIILSLLSLTCALCSSQNQGRRQTHIQANPRASRNRFRKDLTKVFESRKTILCWVK